MCTSCSGTVVLILTSLALGVPANPTSQVGGGHHSPERGKHRHSSSDIPVKGERHASERRSHHDASAHKKLSHGFMRSVKEVDGGRHRKVLTATDQKVEFAAAGSAGADCLRDPLEDHFALSMSASALCVCAVTGLIALFLYPTEHKSAETGKMTASNPAQARVNECAPLLQRRPNLDVLDGCRSVMILYVLLYHIHFDGVLPRSLGRMVLNARWLMQYFFVLSGFVMTYVTQGKVDSFDWSSGKLFVGRRLIRLVPAYYAAAFISLGIGLAGGDLRPSSLRPYGAWPVNMLLLQSVWPVKICKPTSGEFQETEFLSLTVNGPGWFTSAVVLLSIMFPFFYNRLPRLEMKRLVGALVFMILLRSLPTMHAHYLPSCHGLKYYTFVLMRVPEFVAGMLSAQVVSLIPPEVMRMPIWGSIFDSTLTFVFCFAYCMGPWDGMTDNGDYFLTGLFCLNIISARCAVVPPDGSKGTGAPASGLLGLLLASPLLVRLSEFTFSAYIIQFQVYRVFHQPWWPFRLANGWWPLYIACIWLAGFGVTRYVEDPLRRYAERWSRGGKA